MKKIIKVSAIKDGTVIDHIPSGRAMEIINYLKLKSKDNDNSIVVGVNFSSSKMTKKDVIKIENKELTSIELDQISVFAPKATITIIRDFDKVKKYKLKTPEFFIDIIICPNPKCITNYEKMETKFVNIHVNPLRVKCFYCEKIFNEKEITLK